MTEREEWQCEQCRKETTEEPALQRKEAGYGGPVILYFCEDCSNE